MKKRLIVAAFSPLLLVVAVKAMQVVYYNSAFVNEAGLAYNNTYTLNLANQGIDNVAAQAIYSTATISAVTFSSSSINLNTSVITANNSFTTALPVLFSTTTGTPPAPLINQTTYYASNTSGTGFTLSTTSAQAQVGTFITFSSSGTGSYAVTPLGYSGTPSFKWQISNDGSNWNDLNVSSVTYNVQTSSSTVWDMGTIDYRWLRLNVVAPTQGGLKLTVNVNGKNTTSYTH